MSQNKERAEIEEARKRREEETAEFANQRVIRERDRGLDLERTRLNNLQELKVLNSAETRSSRKFT